MPTPLDFRTLPLSTSSIAECARFTGRRPYWKLYVIENIIRVIIHSVLVAQLHPNWWSLAVDPKTDRNVQKRKVDYRSQPHHSYPGTHDIYFLFLSDLSRIMLVNAHHFLPVVPDVHNWIARLESVRLPRNVVGHMNWLNTNDVQEIDLLYTDIKSLQRRLARSRFALVVPA
jgi:hypothetical protein